MAPTFQQNIHHIQDGAPGKATSVRTPDQELESNLQYLKALFEAATLGQALFYRDVGVEADAVVGMPVYWNTTRNQFERALAGTETDPASGTLVASDASDVIGVVFSKTTSTLADLLVLGVAELDIANAVSGAVDAGRYYLSAGQAGFMQRQRPAASVSVLHNLGDGRVLVVPQMKDFIEDHIHYRFELAALPAGDHYPPSAGNPHVINNPDVTKPGWLPADHSSFNGQAPAGALFGYNLTEDTSVGNVWPPIPLDAVNLALHSPDDDPLNGLKYVPSELVQFDQNGIWWMSNCYGQVPWPADYISSESSESSATGCPKATAMQMWLSFVQMTYVTDKTVVTSLVSDSELLTVTGCDGNEASTGDLRLNLLLELLIADVGKVGYKAVKEFNTETLQLETGSVVEGIVQGQNVTLASTAQRYLTPGDAGTPVVYQGIVTVTAETDPLGRELPVELFRLDDARQRFTGIVTYIALLEDQVSGLMGKINIPPAGLPTNPYVKIRAVMYAEVAGTPPAVTLKQTLVPRPELPWPTLPAVQTPVTFNVPVAGIVDADDYFEVESDAIQVVAGDTLFFEMERAGSDGYSGELGLIRVGAVIQSGP
jgi:hypothetical protein